MLKSADGQKEREMMIGLKAESDNLVIEPREPAGETGALEKDTKAKERRETLEEDLYDIMSITQLQKSPIRSAAGAETDIAIRPMQQTEMHRSSDSTDDSLGDQDSPDSTDVSLNGQGSFLHIHTPAFFPLTKEKKADERRSFVPDKMRSAQFSNHQYREPEPTPASVKREKTPTEKTFNISAYDHHGTKPRQSHMLDRKERSDTDVLLNKSEVTLRSNRRQMNNNHTGFHSSHPNAFLVNKPAETQGSDSGQKSDMAAVSQTTPCDIFSTKPAETQMPNRRLPFVADDLSHSELRHSELHHSLSSPHRETDETDEAQRRRPVIGDGSHRSFFPPTLFGRHSESGRAVALTLALLMFPVSMCSAAAAESLCGGKEEVKAMAVRKGEVILDCPVAQDVHKTKHSVVIKYVNFSRPVEVLGCDWMRNLQNFDCLESRYGARLIAIKNDSVLATLPEDRMHPSGSYQCWLAPAGMYDRFPDCHICYPPDSTTTTTTTTVSAVTQSATDGHRKPAEPNNRAAPLSDADRGLVTAVVALSIMVLVLLLILIGVGILLLRFMMRGNKNKGKGVYAVDIPAILYEEVSEVTPKGAGETENFMSKYPLH